MSIILKINLQGLRFVTNQYSDLNINLKDLILSYKHLELNQIYLKNESLSLNLTLVLPRGGWLPPPLTVCLRPHKNAKESDPGHLGHLFYILCGHFDEKKKKHGVPPEVGGRVSRQNSKVRGWLPPQNI